MYPNLSLHQPLPSCVSGMSRRKPVCILQAYSQAKHLWFCQLKWIFRKHPYLLFYNLIHSARFTLDHFKSHSWPSVVASVAKRVWDWFPLCTTCPNVLWLWPQLLNVHLLYLVNPNEPASLSCYYRNTRVNGCTLLVTYIRSDSCYGCNLAWSDNISLQCMFIHPVASWTMVLWVWLLLREEIPVKTYEWKKKLTMCCNNLYMCSLVCRPLTMVAPQLKWKKMTS